MLNSKNRVFNPYFSIGTCPMRSGFIIGLELAIDPPTPRGDFVHYDFLKLHYIRHKINAVSPLRLAAFTYNIALYT